MSDMLSQEEIEKLLNGDGMGGDDLSDSELDDADLSNLDDSEFVLQDNNDIMPDEAADMPNMAGLREPNQDALSDLEKDTIGEIGNISMGAAATALHNLLGRKVDITIPTVSVTNYNNLAKKYDIPYVAIHISYVEGLHGDNMLIMKVEDVKAITSILIGSDEFNEGDLSELHLSAISECMNQMMGASATSLSKLINMKINISPPTVEIMNFADALMTDLIDQGDNDMISTAFQMEIEDLFSTEIMLLMDLQFGKNMVKGFFDSQGAASAASDVMDDGSVTPPPPPQSSVGMPPDMDPMYNQPPAQPQPPQPPQMPPDMNPMYNQPPQPPQMPPDMNPMYNQPPMQPPQMPPQGYGYPGYGYPPPMPQQPAYNVQSIQYENFGAPMGIDVGENINMLMDVPLQVTVELGRAKRNLKEILDFNVGSIITLDKIVGEAVDVVVNGKMIAKGEVVVVDDNFAVRITEILKVKPLVAKQ